MGGASQRGAGRTTRAEQLTALLPTAWVGAFAAAAFLWRSLAWEPAVRVDGWAYAAWGQALVRGERPLFELGSTTPKPLGALIGVLVVPLPPERALALVAAAAMAATAAGLFAAAYREAGGVAGGFAVVAFAFGVELNVVLAFGYVDAVVAALIVLAIALPGPFRLGALILAGLLRPEAWLLAAIAGFGEATGSLRRRLGVALAAGAAAPVLWALSDLVLMGDPLGTPEWRSQWRGELDAQTLPWTDVPEAFWEALTTQSTVVLVVVGLVGLALHYRDGRRRGSADEFPLIVVLVWSVLNLLEGRSGEINPRYLLPIACVLPLGCGFLAARVLARAPRVHSPWAGLAVATVALVAITISMNIGNGVLERIERNSALLAARPTIETALSCGRLRVIPRVRARDLIPQLAAASRRSLYRFVLRDRAPYAAVLRHASPDRSTDRGLPSWPHRDTPLGPLAIAPTCAAFGQQGPPG